MGWRASPGTGRREPEEEPGSLLPAAGGHEDALGAGGQHNVPRGVWAGGCLGPPVNRLLSPMRPASDS